MTDVVDKVTRSRMMSGIRGSNTKIEILVRKGLFARGFRYRINEKKLPGKPDIVLPKYRAVIFVHGCFWHGHDCSLFRLPQTRTEFWQKKIAGNHQRDVKIRSFLAQSGWRVLTIWECALRGRGRYSLETILDETETWVRKAEKAAEIRGDNANITEKLA